VCRTESWVVDDPGRRLEVFTEPRGDVYARRAALEPPAWVRPGSVSVAPLALHELPEGV